MATPYVNETKPRPKVGLAVWLKSPDHPSAILLGKRKGAYGEGLYALPGGHLEFGESWEECARREVLEETGLKLLDVKFQTVINIVYPEDSYHYIDILMIGEVDREFKKEPENLEPHKCEGWKWHEWEKFPPTSEQFKPLQTILSLGINPFAES